MGADEFCYAPAADVAASLLPALVESHRREGGSSLLDVNGPVGRDGSVTDDAPMRSTEPREFYDAAVRDDGGEVLFEHYYGP